MNYIEIGPIRIYFYSLILLISFLLGFFLCLKEAKKKNISSEFIYDFAFYLIPICLVGARIYYIIFNFDYYLNNPISMIKVWEGGLAIHGGIIAGAIFTYFYSKKKKVDFLTLTDILVLCLILGQILGRWGNFFNREAYGPITSLETLKQLHIPTFIIQGMKINGAYFHPTFLYESLWNLVGFFLLFLFKKRGKRSGFYLIWYGTGRFFIEMLRQDSLLLFHLKVAMIISVIMILIGIYIMIRGGKNEKV